ncbi:uncharacterized protein LOC125943024 [Dermacentor silvarum]|uniref:uncharacterized protein LOC125943024 n=1 Tax=Dermacentor silvarum TaxID=543639 RepID=UPI002101BEC7|nr:uncharacterized protein LOC125943024 [Dermacentor silvarum]
MYTALGSFFIVLRVSVVNAHVCTPRDVIAKALEDAPNARKLTQLMHEATTTTFFLLYHSENNTFRFKYPCLCVAKAPFSTTKHVPMYVYGYRHKNELRWNITSVQLNKTDEAYLHNNEFSVGIDHGGQVHNEVFQVVYTDYEHCILFWSSMLGTSLFLKGPK